MQPLHVSTPLVESLPLAAAFGAPVYLKMEALQPSGSFKLRGLGHACRLSVAGGATQLVASSGGNAGCAVAYAGRRLGVPVTVFVPASTSEWMREVIRHEGAAVVEYGAAWDDTHLYAARYAAEHGAAYIHPFDDPRIWDGHASIIEECAAMPKPGAVVVAVGGGGLLCGALDGMHRVGWADVPVLAVETEGTASFAKSVAAGRLVTLDAITSIATTLGARTVTARTLEWAKRHTITPWVVTDRAAVDACLRFANDHRLLVEPACGAALAAVYERAAPLAACGSVLVIVCGGAGVNRELLDKWDREV
ncbi:MAG: pyridoxal-phosphate dependent enzyme [Anaerolineae bacterium]|nr:pyridoxal-phosphate dependent enzyme [Anaerolineae bacterium]